MLLPFNQGNFPSHWTTLLSLSSPHQKDSDSTHYLVQLPKELYREKKEQVNYEKEIVYSLLETHAIWIKETRDPSLRHES